ncbi:phage integrase family protein [Pseudaminobacter salicylatoxidans]|uniref:Phage integrase family protein n=1 Tax=Pseudaminobacter salicylatoxidans TaxID=93369 RepID=A0A316C0Q3_PSESE|nr:tyrosine-type recombinase/integrase [Pseudaminobacter salicylatoxidans]PWJ81572.1 phage integrase family protein [Pseudaminobacter salicylatoxidans]
MALTVYKRGRFWWLTGTVRTYEGEQRVHESTGETDEDAAHEIRLNRENEAKRDRDLGPKARYLFEEAVEAYLNAGKSDRFILPILDHFRGTRISDMTGEMVRAAAIDLYPEATYLTWNRQVITPAKAVINLSADAGRCPQVKIKGFSKKDRISRRSKAAPKRAVDRSYIDAFRKHSDDPRLSALMLFMFQTGARISDALKLEDDSADVDLVERRVIFRDMKNGEDGEADITIEMVYEIQQLRIWRQERLIEWEERIPWSRKRSGKRDSGRGAMKPNNRLFGFISRGSVYKGIKRICEKAKLPYLGTHQPGRHSFATEMIVRNRIDVVTTAKKGRWSDPQVLLNHYAHEESGSGVIDKVFGKKGRKRAG